MKIREIIAEAKKPTAPKARNFVAKNAPKTGAGAHKDKKKAQKQGDVKHKGKVAETATAGATSAANVSVGAVYPNKKAKKHKGVAPNALDSNNLLTGSSLVKRR